LERKNALKHFAGIAVAAVGVASSPAPAIGEEASAPPAFRIESRSFSPHGSMARDFTCDGRDVSPPLAWSHVPAGTRSLVLIVDEAGTRQGLNDWRRTGYSGPCPPIGRHRYFHKLYALDAILPDLGTPTKARLEEAMKGHVLGVAELMGTYGRKD
jgi:phosphatidylethanolamine-binding protein (PEBP) family uncharacterized protein